MNKKRRSAAETRANLSEILRQVERGSSVEVTRRGKPVAVLLSLREYERLGNGSRTFEGAFAEFRRTVDLKALQIDPGIFEGLRDRSAGREARL